MSSRGRRTRFLYPVTIAGRVFGIIITFLGVGMVAIPTGILSAGFVEHYTRIKTMNEASEESDIRFVQLRVGLRVSELDISRKTMIVMIRREIRC